MKNQFFVLGIFFITGMFIGVIFDCFRASRRAVKTGVFLTCLEDIIFWIIAGVTVICSSMIASNGTLRFYMLVMMGCGIFIYEFYFSKFLIKIFTHIFLRN